MLDPALSELAEHYGIEPGYHDIWGVWHEVSTATVRDLLSAMGVRFDGADDVEHATRDAKGEYWSRLLPAAVVVRRSALAEGITLRISGSPRGRLDWRIVEERGRVREGASGIGELRKAGECEFDGISRHGALLPLPPVPIGYHRLEVALGARRPRTVASLIVSPDKCYLPAGIARGERAWGVALQLYGLRSARNWGIGDFGDLAEAADQWAARGAAFVGVNPLHALYLANPDHASPYSPSSRKFLNALYLDVEAIGEFAECAAAQDLVRSPGFAEELERLRGQALVDYPGVAAAKTRVLALLHEHFSRSGAGSPRRASFEDFCRSGGQALRLFAVYEALYGHFHDIDAATGSWMQWPQAYRNPQSAEVAQFARDQAHRVEFFLYLQWQAAVQLSAAGNRCVERGQPIGLSLDLAVSVDRGGADAWAGQGLYALGASVGAPPDEFNLAGQDWGLPPANAQVMERTGYAAFIELVRANMTAAGALRIDHVMGLARLFWLPLNGGAAHGAYVRYPLADLLGIIALESERNRCMVIGEDLGTVPVQLRCALRQWGVLSYRLLMFERDSEHRFQPPADYPNQSLVAFSTHDLPTFVGYWRAQEPATRKALLDALRDADLMPEGANDNVDYNADVPAEGIARLSHAVHLYIARSPALVLAVQIDDLTGAAGQANVPGTPDAAPNWRRKLDVTMEAMSTDPRLQRTGEELCAARAAHARPGA